MTSDIINKILEEDISDIFLGNLSTVEFNLTLPLKGKRGSDFSWKSGEILFISDKGEVTRPTKGVGNREVELVVTATKDEYSLKKTFVVTVLEEQPKQKIIRCIDPQIVLEPNRLVLTDYCVVELDDGSFTTSRVIWEKPINKSLGYQKINGQLEDSELKVTAYIKIRDSARYKIKPEKLQAHSVSLLPGSLWWDASNRMLEHLKTVNMDMLLFNFREVAGLDTKGAIPMTGWDAPECKLKGHTTGHYLSAFSLAYYAAKDRELKSRVDYLVGELNGCQVALEKMGFSKGFLSAYDEKQFDLLEEMVTYPNIWAPYYTLDKILTGLMDCYQFADIKIALDMACGIGDWIYNRLSKLDRKQLSEMWSIYIAGEFGCLISGLVRLSRISGQYKYLDTAFLFENHKLYTSMLMGLDSLNGMHANQHIPQIIGAIYFYEETGEKKYLTIARNFWKIVAEHHSYVIGGIGETEMFKGSDEIGSYLTTKTAESCASYNMLKLTKRLYDLSEDAEYMDYYENTFHNHLLSATSHGCDGGTTYFMPLSPGAIKKFDTIANTCCHGTGLETLFRFQKDIYSQKNSNIYVNLFYPSLLKLENPNAQIRQSVSDDYFLWHIETELSLTLFIRNAHWFDIIRLKIDSTEIDEDFYQQYIKVNCPPGTHIIELHYNPLVRVHHCKDVQNYIAISHGRDVMVMRSDRGVMHNLNYADIPSSIEDFKSKGFVPLNKISDEAYHVYFRVGDS